MKKLPVRSCPDANMLVLYYELTNQDIHSRHQGTYSIEVCVLYTKSKSQVAKKGIH